MVHERRRGDSVDRVDGGSVDCVVSNWCGVHRVMGHRVDCVVGDWVDGVVGDWVNGVVGDWVDGVVGHRVGSGGVIGRFRVRLAFVVNISDEAVLMVSVVAHDLYPPVRQLNAVFACTHQWNSNRRKKGLKILTLKQHYI